MNAAPTVPRVNWTAIALVTPAWHARPITEQAWQITESARFGPFPPWVTAALDDQWAREELGEHIEDAQAFCVQVAYEARASVPGDPGSGEQHEHDQARAQIQEAVTLLWLARRSEFGFDKTILGEETADGWTWRELASHDSRVALPSYRSIELEPADFQTALQLSKGLTTAKNRGAVRTAVHSLSLALCQRSWPLRYLSLWLALEGLFGPAGAGETTFRLCQRIALFTAGRGPKAVELFGQIKKLYGWRSQAVHGMRLQKLDSTTSETVLEQAETFLQSSLSKILTTPGLVEVFDTKVRDDYLDSLALT